MHFFHSYLASIFRHSGTSPPPTAPPKNFPQDYVEYKPDPSQRPTNSMARPGLPPRKSSLCSQPQQIIRSIEKAIILQDRSALLQNCRLSQQSPSLLDFWHLDLLHDLLICRNLISPEARQEIVDQRNKRAEIPCILTYSETKAVFSTMKAKTWTRSPTHPPQQYCEEDIKQALQEYESMDMECLVNLSLLVQNKAHEVCNFKVC